MGDFRNKIKRLEDGERERQKPAEQKPKPPPPSCQCGFDWHQRQLWYVCDMADKGAMPVLCCIVCMPGYGRAQLAQIGYGDGDPDARAFSFTGRKEWAGKTEL